MRRLNLLTVVILTLSTLFVGSPSSVAYAGSTLSLGGINLYGYCRYVLVSPPGEAVLVQHNAYGWRCRLPNTNAYFSIDMNRACKWQYGSWGQVWASTWNTADPYSWWCYRYLDNNA